ncbi:MAG: hypothetical protein WC337_10870, partial [Candidatus Muiribacteriota bacterium]
MNTRKILLIIFLLFTVIINSNQIEYIENITNYAEYVTELLEYIKTDGIEYEKFNKIIEKIDLEKEIIIEKTIKYPVNVEKLRNYIEENPEHGEYFAEIIEIIKEYTGQHTNNINIKKLNTELVNLSSINSNNNIKNNRDETGQDSLDPEHSDMGTPKISPEKDSKNPLFKPDKFLPDDPTIPYYLWLPKDPNKSNNNEPEIPENLHCTVKNTTPEASNDISQSTPTKKVLRYQENKKRDWGWGEYDNLPLGHGHYLADFQIIFEEIEEHNGKLARRYVDRLHNIHTFYYEVDNKWHPARLHFNKMEETDEYIIITEKNGKKLYFTQGRIQFETDNNGNKTTYHYDQDGRLLEKKLPNGLSTKYVWGTNSGNRVVEMIGFDGKTQFKFEYNSTMNIMTDIVLNDGSRIVKGHDEYGRTINVNTRQQNYKTYKYDSKGRIVEFGDGKNDYIRRTYTESGPYTIIIDKSDLGRERKYVYFKSNRIKQIIDYTGAEYNYTYNANGLPTSVSDKYGMEFKLNYDNMGNLISYKNPYGGITYIKYNKFHKPVQVTDPEGNITKYEYDDRGNLIKTINPDGKQSTFTIDEYGRIVSMTDFENNEYEITYDEHWNISSVTDPDGNKIEYTTDMLGRITAIKDRNGKEEKFEYTFEHNLSKYIKKDGNSIDINYTNFGKIKEISDEEQNKTEYHYDYKGDLIKVKDEIGETEIKLDLLNQPVEITDAQGAVTKIKYGTKNLSLPVEVTDAEGRKIKYSYRLDGKIRSIMDEEKRGIFYNYNQAGNISEVYISGKLAYKMEYDKIGRTKSITNGKNEKTEINYTKTGQIKSITDPEGNTIRYEYDGNGNRIKIIEPEGNITEVKYTNTGLIEAVRKAAGENKNIEETITKYEYNKEGQLTTIKLPDGLRKFVKYNEVDNLVNYIPETGEEIKYDYDKKGNLTKR